MPYEQWSSHRRSRRCAGIAGAAAVAVSCLLLSTVGLLTTVGTAFAQESGGADPAGEADPANQAAELDHVGNYNFRVEIAGPGGAVFGEFDELSQKQTTSAGVKYSNITLKRGYISSNPIWTWRSESATLEITGRGTSGPRCRLVAYDAVVTSVRGERTDGRAEVTLRTGRVEGRC